MISTIIGLLFSIFMPIISDGLSFRLFWRGFYLIGESEFHWNHYWLVIPILIWLGFLVTFIGIIFYRNVHDNIYKRFIDREKKWKFILSGAIITTGTLMSLLSIILIVIFKSQNINEIYPSSSFSFSFIVTAICCSLNFILGLQTIIKPLYSFTTYDYAILPEEKTKEKYQKVDKVTNKVNRVAKLSGISIFHIIESIGMMFVVGFFIFAVVVMTKNDYEDNQITNDFMQFLVVVVFTVFGYLLFLGAIRIYFLAKTSKLKLNDKNKKVKYHFKSIIQSNRFTYQKGSRFLFAVFVGSTILSVALILLTFIIPNVQNKPEVLDHKGGTGVSIALLAFCNWISRELLNVIRWIYLIQIMIMLGLCLLLSGFIVGVITKGQIKGMFAGLISAFVFLIIVSGLGAGKNLNLILVYNTKNLLNFKIWYLVIIELVISPILGFLGGFLNRQNKSNKFPFYISPDQKDEAKGIFAKIGMNKETKNQNKNNQLVKDESREYGEYLITDEK